MRTFSSLSLLLFMSIIAIKLVNRYEYTENDENGNVIMNCECWDKKRLLAPWNDLGIHKSNTRHYLTIRKNLLGDMCECEQVEQVEQEKEVNFQGNDVTDESSELNSDELAYIRRKSLRRVRRAGKKTPWEATSYEDEETKIKKKSKVVKSPPKPKPSHAPAKENSGKAKKMEDKLDANLDDLFGDGGSDVTTAKPKTKISKKKKTKSKKPPTKRHIRGNRHHHGHGHTHNDQ